MYRNGISITGAHGTEFRPVQSGSYYAMLFSFEGCSLATEKRDVLIDSPRPGIRYPLQYAVENLPMSLQARTFGTSVVWTPDNYLTNPTSVTPVFKSPVEQEYRIEITTATGCLTIDTQLVKTVKNVDIYVPTAFTPNNDGLNDLLRPTLMGVKKLNYFRVYNRWGQMMYETATERAGWDGRLRGLEQGSQVVVWTAEGLGVDGKIYMKKGTSVLVR